MTHLLYIMKYKNVTHGRKAIVTFSVNHHDTVKRSENENIECCILMYFFFTFMSLNTILVSWFYRVSSSFPTVRSVDLRNFDALVPLPSSDILFLTASPLPSSAFHLVLFFWKANTKYKAEKQNWYIITTHMRPQ